MTQEEFARHIVDMQDTLYRVATTILPRLHDREDAVQQAIEKAWRNQRALREDSAMKSWVVRILINECYALLRRSKREIPSETLPEREAAPDAKVDVYQLFTSLDKKHRLPMVLYYVEGYTIEEISRILLRPQGTIKSQLHRGRMMLRNNLSLEEARI